MTSNLDSIVGSVRDISRRSVVDDLAGQGSKLNRLPNSSGICIYSKNFDRNNCQGIDSLDAAIF